MKSHNGLKIGDRIVITGVPGEGVANYYIHPDTVRVFRVLAKRKRPVRISSIDERGEPWYYVRLKERGRWHQHHLSVGRGETNWRRVQKKKS